MANEWAVGRRATREAKRPKFEASAYGVCDWRYG
jgi:hypothetical protein